MSFSGIAPTTNYPANALVVPYEPVLDRLQDLAEMVDLLHRLTGVWIVDTDLESEEALQSTLRATVELDLDRWNPAIDFMEQIVSLIKELTQDEGLVVHQRLAQALERLADHLRTVSDAEYATTSAQPNERTPK